MIMPETKKIKKLAGYSIGDFTYGEPTVMNWKEGTTLKIGKYCSIANGVNILLGGNHRSNWISQYPFPCLITLKTYPHHTFSNGDVVIGNDVWIGYGSTILSGVTIGDGAVIGAKSVVTKDVKPYRIIGGNPASFIRYRFDPSVISQLLKIRWWEWDHAKVVANASLLCSPNLEEFLELHGVDHD
jgi:acetyltransferase-like isoleucine patch superfamily enzyme